MNNNIKNVHFLTSKQVSKYLYIPLRTVQKLSKEGKIRAVKIGNQWRYKKADIEYYISSGTDFSKEPSRKPDNFVERRAYPRINTNLKCSYSLNLPPFKQINSEGIIKNISAVGVLLIMKNGELKEIQIDDPVDMDFILSLDNQQININANGKVVRRTDEGVGIKFRNVSKEMQNRILEYAG